MNKTLVVIVLALAAACSKSSSSESATAPAGTAPAAAEPAPREAKDILADDRIIAGYALYMKEMAPHSKVAFEVVAAAYQKSGDDAKKLEKAAKADPRIVEYNKLNEAALKKAGLNNDEVQILSLALATYMAEVWVAQGASDAAAQINAAEEKFAGRYGAAALATVRRHLPDLLAAQDAMMKATLGK